ncbi:hypothetical protein AgCh_004929 [Apium graveolens]
MESEEGSLVLLKVSPWKGLTRFGKKGKPSPRYVGPFKILKHIGKIAFELALPPHMEHIHNIFHVSMLKKYNPDFSIRGLAKSKSAPSRMVLDVLQSPPASSMAAVMAAGGGGGRWCNSVVTAFLNQVRSVPVEAGGKGSAKKDLNNQRNTFCDILDYLEDGYSPETSIKIGGESLNTMTWSQLIQLNNLKQFLAGDFVKQMQDNEVLHDIFGFSPKRKLFSARERSGWWSRGESEANSSISF